MYRSLNAQSKVGDSTDLVLNSEMARNQVEDLVNEYRVNFDQQSADNAIKIAGLETLEHSVSSKIFLLNNLVSVKCTSGSFFA